MFIQFIRLFLKKAINANKFHWHYLSWGWHACQTRAHRLDLPSIAIEKNWGRHWISQNTRISHAIVSICYSFNLFCVQYWLWHAANNQKPVARLWFHRNSYILLLVSLSREFMCRDFFFLFRFFSVIHFPSTPLNVTKCGRFRNKILPSQISNGFR